MCSQSGDSSDIHVNTMLYVTSSSVRGEGDLVSIESVEDEKGWWAG